MGKRHFLAIQICAALAVTLCMSAKAPAATVVNWGSTGYVTGNKPFNDGNLVPTFADWDADESADDYGMRRPFSEITPLSPASGYATPPGKSGLFYGGFDFVQPDTSKSAKPTINMKAIINNGNGDQLAYMVTPTLGSTHFAVAFLKSGFLNNGSTNTDYLDAADTSISVNFITLQNIVGRFMVKNGQQWYLSEATITSPGLTTLANPSQNSRWALYDPASSLDFNASGATFISLKLNDVQGVGYYGENDNIPFQATAGAILVEMAVNANFNPAPVTPPISGAVPLPPAAWPGLALLATLASRQALRRRP